MAGWWQYDNMQVLFEMMKIKYKKKKKFWKGKLAIKVHSKRDKKDKNYMQGKSIKLILINYLQNTNQSLTKIKKKKKNVYYDSL